MPSAPRAEGVHPDPLGEAPRHAEPTAPRAAGGPTAASIRAAATTSTCRRHRACVRASPPRPVPAAALRSRASATPGRVTVEIRGRTVPAPAVPRPAEPDRRRPQRRPVERVGTRPDRVAMWALMMGLLLILVAIGTADTPAVSSLLLAL